MSVLARLHIVFRKLRRWWHYRPLRRYCRTVKPGLGPIHRIPTAGG